METTQILYKGSCHLIGEGSDVLVDKVPWILKNQNHRPGEKANQFGDSNLKLPMVDLFLTRTKEWDIEKVQRFFAEEDFKNIFQVNVANSNVDELI